MSSDIGCGIVFLDTVDHECRVLRWLSKSPYDMIGVYFGDRDGYKFIMMDCFNYRFRKIYSECKSFGDVLMHPVTKRVRVRKILKIPSSENKNTKNFFDVKLASRLKEMITCDPKIMEKEIFKVFFPLNHSTVLVDSILRSFLESLNRNGDSNATMNKTCYYDECELLGPLEEIDFQSTKLSSFVSMKESLRILKEIAPENEVSVHCTHLIERISCLFKEKSRTDEGFVLNAVNVITRYPEGNISSDLGRSYNSLVNTLHNSDRASDIRESLDRVSEEIESAEAVNGHNKSSLIMFDPKKFSKNRFSCEISSSRDPRPVTSRLLKNLSDIHSNPDTPININDVVTVVNYMSDSFKIKNSVPYFKPRTKRGGAYLPLNFKTDAPDINVVLDTSGREITLGDKGTPIHKLTRVEMIEISDMLDSYPGVFKSLTEYGARIKSKLA